MLEAETFTSELRYDALGRVFEQIAPDGSSTKPEYHQLGKLNRVTVKLNNETDYTEFVSSIRYNSKGQREIIVYGNSTETEYTYERETFRLTSLTTTRTTDNKCLQEISYTYDPVGNITEIIDNSHGRVYNSNLIVDPKNGFVYDAIYQLTEAQGREHLWRIDQILFSKFGTLLDTVEHLVCESQAGYTSIELRAILTLETKEQLMQLWVETRLSRELIDGIFVYTSSDSTRKKLQLLSRKQGATGDVGSSSLEQEVKAAIILFYSILDEQQRRLYAGLESIKQGRGGDAIVARLLNVDPHTVAKGRAQLLEADISLSNSSSTMFDKSGDSGPPYAKNNIMQSNYK